MHLDLCRDLGIDVAALEVRGLVPCAEPPALVVAGIEASGRQHLLTPAAAIAWGRMRHAAATDGITLHIVSAFRSIERQAAIVRRKLAAGQALADILTVSAAPGYSEHHTGRAVDLGTPGSAVLEQDFATTPAYAWLRDEALRFGFRLSYPPHNARGYAFEPWHWCHA